MNAKIFRSLSALVFFALICFAGNGCGDEKDDDSWYTDITVGTPVNSDIKAYGSKVYRINFTAAGDYTAILSNLASDCGMTFCTYDESDNNIDDLVDNIQYEADDYDDNSDEGAVLSIYSTGYLYIVVDEYSEVESSFTLTVTADTTKSDLKAVNLDLNSKKSGNIENSVIDKIMDKWKLKK